MTATEIVVEREEKSLLEDVPLKEFQLPCPHCRRLGSIRDAECPSCGLIYAKWRKRDVAPTPPKAAPAFWTTRLRAAALTAAVGVGMALCAAAATTLSISQVDSGPCGCSMVDR